MGSSRWFVLVLLVCYVLALTSSALGKYAFVNDFRAYSEEEVAWSVTVFRAMLIDDKDNVTLFWDGRMDKPGYSNFWQIFYRHLDASGTYLTEPRLVTDSSRYGTFYMLNPGGNCSGRWAIPNLIRWCCPEWPLCETSVLVWLSDKDGELADTGIVVGSQLPMPGDNTFSAVDVDSAGNFVVAWVNSAQPESPTIWCQIYCPDGAPKSDSIRVLDRSCVYDSTLFGAGHPQVAVAAGGDFVVVFQAGCDGCEPGDFANDIMMRPYHADGTPKTDLLCASCWGDSINTYWNGGQSPDVAMEDNGDYAICWQLYINNCWARDVVRRFYADGTPKGQQVLLDRDLCSSGTVPYVASDSIGNLVVVWTTDNGDKGTCNLIAQRFDTSGAPVGCNFKINDGYYDVNSTSTSVALNNNGLVGFIWRETPAEGARDMVQLMDLQDVGIYVHADANNDRMVNVSDAVFLISYIFGGGQPPAHVCLGDADGNGMVNISDAVTLIAYIFGGGSLSGECPD